MPSIEMASPADLPEVIRLNMTALAELGEKIIYQPDIEEVSRSVFANWEQAPCFLLKDGGIVGFAGLMLSKTYFSKFPILKDYMFFILPEHRNINNIELLCKAARDFADTTALPLVLNYIITGNQKHQERLFKRMGFKISGLTGVYNG